MTPTLRVRSWKISLPISRSSFSSQNVRIFFMTRRVSSMKPFGRSSLSPADAIEVGVEPPSGRRLDEVQHVLAVAEGEEDRRDGTELHA